MTLRWRLGSLILMDASTWAAGLLVALSLLAGAPPAGAVERLVFDSFLGAQLAPPGEVVDPNRSYDLPAGIAIDRLGVVYVADPNNNRVQVFDGSTVSSLRNFIIRDVTTGQVILNAVLNTPVGVAVDPRNDDVWIANTGNRQLVKIDKNGQLLALVGSHGTGPGQFELPLFIAVDPAGNVYVGDDGGFSGPGPTVQTANIRVQKFRSDGTFVRTLGSFCELAGMRGSCNASAPGAVAVGDGQFSLVSGVAVDSVGNVYVTDAGNARVQKFDPNGTFLLKWGNRVGDFVSPNAVAVDFADNVYVADLVGNRIQKFDDRGAFLTQVGSAGRGLGVFQGPFGIATVPRALVVFCRLLGFECQKIFVSESQNKRVQVLEARPDDDNDSILNDVDPFPTVFSSEAGLGDTGVGLQPLRVGPLAVYGPTRIGTPPNTIRVTTEPAPFGDVFVFDLFCRNPRRDAGRVNVPGGGNFDYRCSTPTLDVLTGPIDWTFTAADGTSVTATLNDGNSLSVDPGTSSIRSNAGTLALVVSGTRLTLAPGQAVFADRTAPTTQAVPSPGPNPNGWNNANVTLTLTAADNAGGSGVKEIQFSLAGAQVGAGIVPGGVATVPISANGVTTLTYFTRDNAGNQEPAKTLTVSIDKNGPTIAGLPEPGCALWPPNHRLVHVATVTADGSVSGIVSESLSVTATSNEPEGGRPDIVITGGVVHLRAERSEHGTGRIYTVTASVTDLAGTTATATATCTVPRHRHLHGARPRSFPDAPVEDVPAVLGIGPHLTGPAPRLHGLGPGVAREHLGALELVERAVFRLVLDHDRPALAPDDHGQLLPLEARNRDHASWLLRSCLALGVVP